MGWVPVITNTSLFLFETEKTEKEQLCSAMCHLSCVVSCQVQYNIVLNKCVKI